VNGLIEKIWERDASAWTGKDEAQWLGWLDEPLTMQEQIGDIKRLADAWSGAVDNIVLCGMGGSSLAPEVLRRLFEVRNFHVLDTTHPQAIRALESALDLDRTGFVASSKSGTTLETRSHLDYFWEKTGGGHPEHFAAVTDPGSDLEHTARERGFAAVFAGEPTIGGRYSALSPFGIVPAVLMGIDAAQLLERAQAMRELCRSGEGNPGYELGSRMGEAWRDGRDKVCIADSGTGFGLWAEQLIAESTGKQGKGLIPAPGESPDEGKDRQGADAELPEPYALGAEFFRWEFAVAVAGAYLEINPFDQPDVQAAKDKTNEVLATGEEPELPADGSVEDLLGQAKEGDYVCVQAFVHPTPENDVRIADLVAELRRESGLVVTHGYGPRYLHSTGQLHKGGPNSGLFLQIVDDPGEELPIPGKPFGFRRFIRSQAEGDYESLKARDRRVARIVWED
jgi:transaldolase/glucose-6-phosphate isomerase